MSRVQSVQLNYDGKIPSTLSKNGKPYDTLDSIGLVKVIIGILRHLFKRPHFVNGNRVLAIIKR